MFKRGLFGQLAVICKRRFQPHKRTPSRCSCQHRRILSLALASRTLNRLSWSPHPVVCIQSAYGLAMQYVSGGITQWNTGSGTAASFAGILVREVPSISGASCR